MRSARLRRLVGILLATGVVAASAACGDDGGGRLSRAEYVRQADEICARYDAELGEIEQALERAETPQAAANAIERGIPIVEGGIADLRELEPPEELEEDVDRWLELNDENVENLEELRDAAEAGDTQRAQEIATRGSRTEEESDEVAREIGLEDCAAD